MLRRSRWSVMQTWSSRLAATPPSPSSGGRSSLMSHKLSQPGRHWDTRHRTILSPECPYGMSCISPTHTSMQQMQLTLWKCWNRCCRCARKSFAGARMLYSACDVAAVQLQVRIMECLLPHKCSTRRRVVSRLCHALLAPLAGMYYLLALLACTITNTRQPASATACCTCLVWGSTCLNVAFHSENFHSVPSYGA